MNTIDICSDFDIMAICFGAIIVCILVGYVCYRIDKHNREGKMTTITITRCPNSGKKYH